MRWLVLCAGVLLGCSDRRAPWTNAPDTAVTAPRDSGEQDEQDKDHDGDHEKGKDKHHGDEDAAKP